MKRNNLVCLVTGFAVGVAAAVASKKTVDKIAGEVRENLCEHCFTSPEGDHFVKISYGASDFAKGLTYIRVTAGAEGKEDDCRLVVMALKNGAAFSGEWFDNDHFRLLVGSGKRRQCCDVDYDDGEIMAEYYLRTME